MGRLTEKMNNEHYQYKCSINCFEYGDGDLEIFDKLGKLEDIEEELGIPLEVLFKALKDGAYTKIDGQIWKCNNINIYYSDYFKKYLLEAYCIENIETFKHSYEHQLNIEDYGKNWSLTKEELE